MSPAVSYAHLMAAFHNRYGVIPDYEAMLEATYRRVVSPGHVVADVGAHTGRHAAVLRDLVGPSGAVHAFEPLPWAADILRNRGLGPTVHIHAVALSDQAGETEFTFCRGTPEESGLKPKAYNQPGLAQPEQITVQMARLDDFAELFPRLDFVKVDAEGAEVSCLKGARSLLARHRPFVSVEYGHPSYSAHGLTAQSLFEEAAHQGYHVGDLFGAVCRTPEEWQAVCDVAYWDWCLVPRERLAEWTSKVSIAPGAEAAVTPHPAAPTPREAELDRQLAAMRASTSWKVTAPLRSLRRLLG